MLAMAMPPQAMSLLPRVIALMDDQEEERAARVGDGDASSGRIAELEARVKELEAELEALKKVWNGACVDVSMCGSTTEFEVPVREI